MYKSEITKGNEVVKLEKKAFKIAEELGENYVSMLKEDFDENLPEVLREYIAVNYPILSEDAEKVFEEALEVARGIEDKYSRASALSNIASELAKVDVDRALSVAREIEDDSDRAEALRNIATELAKVDVDRAKRIFEEALSVARGIESDYSRASALRNIATELAKVDVDRALSVARGIEKDSSRASALRNIATELAKVDVKRAIEVFEDALSVARNIEDKYRKEEAIQKIASELAKVDVDRALSVARGIDDKDYRAYALRDIASELAKVDADRAKRIFEEALSVARGIEKDYRAWALPNIASELAKVDVDRALSVARKIDDKDDRASALRDIAKELAKQEAKKILTEMPDKLVLRMVMEGWGARQIKNTIKNYMEHGGDISGIYSRYEELNEYLKPFGITEELPEMDHAHIDTWIMESKRIITEMEQKKKEIEGLKDSISELRGKAHMIGIKIPENITTIDEMKRLISEAEKRMESIKSSLSLNISGDITENLWSKAEVVVKNDGDIDLENISIEFQTDVMDVRGETKINSIKKGEERRIPIRMKSKDAGYVPVEVLVSYRNPLTEKDEEMKLFPEIFVASRTMTPSITPTPIGTEPPISEPNIQKLTRYELIEEMGSGGFALVYKVKRKSDERIVAVKIPKRWDEDSSSAFIDEVSIWQSLSRQDSAHIVKILRRSAVPFGYIEMEYMQKSLADLRFPLDPKVASEYMLSVAYGIYTAHSQRPPVIHMDIKPSNILINSEGTAKLADWGIAAKKYKSSDLGGIGTLDFCSPEVLDPIEYGKPDEQSDIFSFGSTFYYILTGVKPFSGRNEEETMDNILSRDFVPKKPSEYNPDVPEAIDSIVMKCIEKSKEKRYARITEVIFELSEHLGIKVDFSTSSSTYLMADALLYQAKNGNVKGTIEALKIIRKRAKTREFREKIDAIIRPLKQYLEEGNPRENSILKDDREMQERIREIAERFKIGR